MERNKQEKKLKELGRLANELDDIGYRDYEWVPVDKPRFIGWDLQVVLSESGARRRDALKLQEILNACAPKVFVRDMGVVKKARAAGLRVDLMTYNPRKDRYLTDHRDELFRKRLSQWQYDRLADHLKSFYSPENRLTYSGTPYKEYWLIQGYFPFYETTIKITKAYSTHIGIPIAENWKRSEEIHHIIREENYWCSKNGFHNGRSKWGRRFELKTYRNKWSHATKMIAKEYQTEGVVVREWDNWDEEFVDYDYDTVERFTKETKHKLTRTWW